MRHIKIILTKEQNEKENDAYYSIKSPELSCISLAVTYNMLFYTFVRRTLLTTVMALASGLAGSDATGCAEQTFSTERTSKVLRSLITCIGR
jgi:hypothetical protein